MEVAVVVGYVDMIDRNSRGVDESLVRVLEDLNLKRYSVAPANPLNLRASVVGVECVEVHIDPQLTLRLVAGVVGIPYRLRACSASLTDDDSEVGHGVRCGVGWLCGNDKASLPWLSTDC